MKIRNLCIFLIILVLAIQFVSAGFFEDMFNKITGSATENVDIESVQLRENKIGVIECEISVPLEIHENCYLEEGSLVIRKDDKGCIKFVECIRRGNVNIISEEIGEIPPATNLLSIALKLETLKIEFDQMIRKLKGVVNYYEGTGNTAEAEKFRKVLGLFSNANVKIESVKVKLKETANDMTEEDLRDIKHDIKYISEVVMQDALYIILGGEIKLEGSIGITEEGYTDCGTDSKCIDEALRLCEPAVANYPKPLEDFFVKIKGLDDDVCIIEATYQGEDLVCKIKDYATLRSEGRDIMQYCKGGGLKMFKIITTIKTGTPRIQTSEECEKIIESDEKDRCYFRLGLATNDFSLCEKIVDQNPYEGCYYNIAKKSRESNLCEKITDIPLKQKCYAEIGSIKSESPEGEVAEEKYTIRSRVAPTIDGNILYFYNDACPNCDTQELVITEIEKSLGGFIKVERLDTEKESEKAERYGINAVPSMVYIRLDGCTKTKIGYTEYDELEEWIYSDECVGGAPQ